MLLSEYMYSMYHIQKKEANSLYSKTTIHLNYLEKSTPAFLVGTSLHLLVLAMIFEIIQLAAYVVIIGDKKWLSKSEHPDK